MKRHFALFTLASALLLTLFLTACPVDYVASGNPMTYIPTGITVKDSLVIGTSHTTLKSFGIGNTSSLVAFGDNQGGSNHSTTTYTVNVVKIASALGISPTKITKVALNFKVCDFNYWTQITGIGVTVNGNSSSIDVVSATIGNNQVCSMSTVLVTTSALTFTYTGTQTGTIVIDAANASIYGAIVDIPSMNIYYNE